MNRFMDSKHPRPVLLLKGYAGTGKTTLLSALVRSLPHFNMKPVLLAPTGRAAKVMATYARRMAFTVHKRIYRWHEADGRRVFEVNPAKKGPLLGVVDEASMIYENHGGMLTDIFRFFFTEQLGNRLILIGDHAQLPPVGQDLSPALQRDYLESVLDAEVFEVELTDVVRQARESGILHNATQLRELLRNSSAETHLSTKGFEDVFRMTGDRLEDGLRYAYDTFGVENTVLLSRSNRSANMYNQYIRRQIHFREDEIEAGEIIMVVRNNYLYSPSEKGGFTANGDFAEIMKVISFEDMYGFRFATLSLRLVDYPATEAFDARVILDTLHENSPSLSEEKEKSLLAAVQEDYADISSASQRWEKLRKDPYLNALQIKFAYALTCHKAQGGQWPAVFIEQGFVKEDQIGQESYVRWLYTAVTRASKQLFFVNFHERFFGNV